MAFILIAWPLSLQIRAFRESAVTLGRSSAEALLKVGQGPLAAPDR